MARIIDGTCITSSSTKSSLKQAFEIKLTLNTFYRILEAKKTIKSEKKAHFFTTREMTI